MNEFKRTRAAIATLVISVLMPASVMAQTKVKSGFNMFSAEQDVEIGRQSASEIERQLPLARSSVAQDYVQALGSKLAAQATGPRFPYQFRVVDASDLNAFALPGGPIYLNRGILEAAQNEGEVAGVLAHEIAHVSLRHGTHAASKAYLAQAGLGLLGGLLGGKVGGNTAQIINLVGGFGLNALFLKYSREAETQSDIIGTQMLVKAGYNPSDMVGFFRTLAKQDKRKSAGFLSSHPAPARRIERIQQEASLLGVPPAATTRATELNKVKSALRSLPPARTSEEIARLSQGRQPTGTSSGTRRPSSSASGVRVEAPSSSMARYTSKSRLFQVAHPANWQVVDEGNSSVLIAPRGGAGQVNGNSEVVYGAIVNHYEPFGNRKSRRTSGAVGEATDDLLAQIVRTSPHLRLLRGSKRSVNAKGGTVLTATLVGSNPNTRMEERVTVGTRQLDDDHLVYMLVVTPERDAAAYQRVTQAMIASLAVDEDHRH